MAGGNADLRSVGGKRLEPAVLDELGVVVVAIVCDLEVFFVVGVEACQDLNATLLNMGLF